MTDASGQTRTRADGCGPARTVAPSTEQAIWNVLRLAEAYRQTVVGLNEAFRARRGDWMTITPALATAQAARLRACVCGLGVIPWQPLPALRERAPEFRRLVHQLCAVQTSANASAAQWPAGGRIGHELACVQVAIGRVVSDIRSSRILERSK